MITATLEFIAALVCTWPMHALAALLFIGPTVMFRRHRGLPTQAWQFVLLPWLAWLFAFIFWPSPKSLTTAVVDSLALGVTAGLAAIIGVTFSDVVRRWSLGVASVVGVILAATVPFFGE
jgi:hypothetical protein